MVEINLLKSLPKSKRNTNERKSKKTAKHIKKFPKNMGICTLMVQEIYGYGGYFYDGRWNCL